MDTYTVFASLDELKRAVVAGRGKISTERVIIGENVPKSLQTNLGNRRPNIVVCLAEDDSRAVNRAVIADDGRHVVGIIPSEKETDQPTMPCVPVFMFAMKRVYPILQHANQAKDLIPLLAKYGHGTKYTSLTASEVFGADKPKKKPTTKATRSNKKESGSPVVPEESTNGEEI